MQSSFVASLSGIPLSRRRVSPETGTHTHMYKHHINQEDESDSCSLAEEYNELEQLIGSHNDSMTSANLNYHAIYGPHNTSTSTADQSHSMGEATAQGRPLRPTRHLQTNPQHQLQQQQQLHATQQKNELLEKRIAEIERLMDSDFSEHSERTRQLSAERAK